MRRLQPIFIEQCACNATFRRLIFRGFFDRPRTSVADIRRQKRWKWLPGPCAVKVGSGLIGEVI
jgi:hypothetical protein